MPPGRSTSIRIRPMHPEARSSLEDLLLPPGRMVTSDEGEGDAQPLWLSDGPATAELWTQMHAEHTRSGLWPLLLDSLDPNDGGFRPWGSGEAYPEQMSSPASRGPASLLAQWWATYTAVDEDDAMLDADRRLAVTALQTELARPRAQPENGNEPRSTGCRVRAGVPRRPPTDTSGAGRRSVRWRGADCRGLGRILQLRQRHREILRRRPKAEPG